MPSRTKIRRQSFLRRRIRISTSSLAMAFMAIVVSLLFALVVGGLTMLRGGARPSCAAPAARTASSRGRTGTR